MKLTVGQHVKLNHLAEGKYPITRIAPRAFWKVVGLGFGDAGNTVVVTLMVFDESKFRRVQAAQEVLEDAYKSYFYRKKGLVTLLRPVPEDFWYQEALEMWVKRIDIVEEEKET